MGAAARNGETPGVLLGTRCDGRRDCPAPRRETKVERGRKPGALGPNTCRGARFSRVIGPFCRVAARRAARRSDRSAAMAGASNRTSIADPRSASRRGAVCAARAYLNVHCGRVADRGSLPAIMPDRAADARRGRTATPRRLRVARRRSSRAPVRTRQFTFPRTPGRSRRAQPIRVGGLRRIARRSDCRDGRARGGGAHRRSACCDARARTPADCRMRAQTSPDGAARARHCGTSTSEVTVGGHRAFES
jgi:hypothetical protein